MFHLAPGSAIELTPNVDRPRTRNELALTDDAFLSIDATIVTNASGARLVMNSGTCVGFPLRLRPRDRVLLKMQIVAPKDAKPGDSFTTRLVQRTSFDETVGEWDVTVNVVEPPLPRDRAPG